MDSFKSFEPALKRGELKVERGRIDPSLIIHADEPQGKVRITYARMDGNSVVGIAIITPAEFENGLPVFQIGYAVPQHLRKRGIAKKLVQAAIDEFTSGVKRGGVVHFYIEAMVGVKNIGSQKVAAHVIGGEPRETKDHNSGEAILQYIKEIGQGTNQSPK
ncbi:hypothetical protein ASF09_11545 [Sphingomonas sp. Leaf242]|nr:hypothetical protein ASF09_11545 [Sphingomonas sp. Leaf242]